MIELLGIYRVYSKVFCSDNTFNPENLEKNLEGG